MRRIALVIALLLAAPLPLLAQEPDAPAATPARTARLRGTLLSLADSTPIANAVVSLVGLDTSVTTNSRGSFDFGRLEPGPYIVQARAISFEPYTIRAELADSASLDLVFRMRVASIRLGDQVVTAKAPPRTRFEERLAESRGFGRFVTREQIEARGTPFLCDLLRGQPGLRVAGGNSSGCVVRVSRAQGLSIQAPDCAPGFFLDGARLNIDLLENNGIPPSNIEGIEIYRSSAETPGEFNAFNTCGVIAVWTRRS